MGSDGNQTSRGHMFGIYPVGPVVRYQTGRPQFGSSSLLGSFRCLRAFPLKIILKERDRIRQFLST